MRCDRLTAWVARLFVVGIAVTAIKARAVAADPVAPDESVAGPIAALNELKRSHPSLAWIASDELVHRLYGTTMAVGASPEEAAGRFIAEYASSLRVRIDDLLPLSRLPDGRHVQPLMYDAATDGYKFTLVYYSQARGGLPVYGAELRLLVRNEPNHPLVLAASTLRPLGDFTVDLMLATKPFDPATQSQTGMTHFSNPETVIWAGVEDQVAAPTLAVTFIGDNGRTDAAMEIWRFVCDAITGQVLHQESLIQHADVTGTIQVRSTPGVVAGNCADEVLGPFPYGHVSIAGGATVFADENGNFTIPNSGETDVTVNSYVEGLYFEVVDHSGPMETLVANVTPPGPVQFVHNLPNNNDAVLAQVNAYKAANDVRSWVLRYNPAFPGASTALGVRINVSRTDGGCPCNAWATFPGGSLNFCSAGVNCDNSAFQSIVYHEYGHLCISWGGSGQGAYGEGMSDCFAILPFDQPQIGLGLFGDCSAAMRTADNFCQYQPFGCSSCGSQIHDCGQLLSGIVWSIRNEFLAIDPVNYLDMISNLVVNSVLLHTGTGINQQIVIDLLTLDDDDAQIGNGTPHRAQICAGAAVHGIACPVLDTEMSVSPSTGAAAFASPGGPATPSSVDYAVHNLSGTTFAYAVTHTAPWITLSNDTGNVAGGTAATVTATINANAAALPAGTHVDTLTISNLATHIGDTTRTITLTISPPRLTVTPLDTLSSSGETGGPFDPPGKVYLLQNTGGDSLNYSVSQSAAWYSLSGTAGTLAPGAFAHSTVTFNANASALPVGSHSGTITFTNTTNQLGNTSRSVLLQVNPLTNDLCANAFSGCPGQVYTGTTAGRTIDVASSCDNSGNTPDVWYRFAPAVAGSATFTLCGAGTTYDSVLSIFSACPLSGGTEWICDDDGCGAGGGPSVISNMPVTGGSIYFIRVSGWGAATGNYSLTIDGPPCSQAVFISLPDGPPTLLSPDAPVTFNVHINNGLETYVPGSARLNYRYVGEDYLSVPLTPLGGPLHTATLPAAPCGIQPRFYITAEGDGGGVAHEPFNAPTGYFAAHVGTLAPFVDFNFEAATGEGWTVGDTGDNATFGIWNRADPEMTTAQPGDDHTPDPGVQCWVTDSRAGTSPASFDVDSGRTTLKSPVFDLAGFTDGIVGYWRWYDNSRGTAPNADTFLVDISNNNGASWTNVETIGPSGPDAMGGWRYHEFQIAQFVTPTAQIRLRFVAQDTGAASLVEAALDDVSIIGQNCVGPPACLTTPGDLDGNGLVDGRDLGGFVQAVLTAFHPCADFNNDQQSTPADVSGMVLALLGP